MRNFINEEFVKQPTSYQQDPNEILNSSDMTDLLSETYNTLNTFGVDMEAPDAMGKVFNDESTAKIYIESLAEGLDAEDTRNFMILSENIMGSITGKGSGSRSIMSMLNESNLSASFLPKAKLIFPMFRFTWPRLHIREIVNVVPMDSPEIVRYFFKAICKNLDGSITPLPSYNPLGQGQIIGSLGDPKFISIPGTVNLLADIGASNTNTHLEKSFMIVGWEGIDPSGATVSDVDSATPLLYTTDADGKFQLHIDVDPKGTSTNQVVDVVSGFVDFELGTISASSTRGMESNGKVTKIKIVCSATSSEHNLAPKIQLEATQVKFQSRDVQLQSEWSEQYLFDTEKRTGIDPLSELTCIMGNQAQLTINTIILNDILYNVGQHGDNIRKFVSEPATGRPAFAYTKKQWADELIYVIEKVSSRIYTATNNMEATHIVCNPEDLVWLTMLSTFSYSGDFQKGGNYGKANVGSVNNGKQVISTPLMPKGYMLLASKPNDVTLANYIFAPYVPLTISPYPLGQIPAMTFTTRFSNKIIRPEGFGLIRIY